MIALSGMLAIKAKISFQKMSTITLKINTILYKALVSSVKAILDLLLSLRRQIMQSQFSKIDQIERSSQRKILQLSNYYPKT